MFVAAAGIVVINEFTWRDSPEEWSQKYHFQGAGPGTPADWRALVDDFLDTYKSVIFTFVNVVRVQCYLNTDDDAVYTYNLADFGGVVAGTATADVGAEGWGDGESGYLLRWNTGRSSSRGKPVYLFKYFHPALISSTDRDKISTAFVAILSGWADGIRDAIGSWPGLADKTGARPVGYLAETFVHRRQLRRGRRRPTS